MNSSFLLENKNFQGCRDTKEFLLEKSQNLSKNICFNKFQLFGNGIMKKNMNVTRFWIFTSKIQEITRTPI